MRFLHAGDSLRADDTLYAPDQAEILPGIEQMGYIRHILYVMHDSMGGNTNRST